MFYWAVIRNEMRNVMRNEMRNEMRNVMRNEVRNEMRNIMGIKSVLQFSSYFVCMYMMYIHTYICNQKFHQHSYGFQNLMSS